MCCSSSRAARLEGSFEEFALNERSMLLLDGDITECPSYDGNFTGTHFYVAGKGTEWEKMFLRGARREAIEYCQAHDVKLAGPINARSFCADRVLALVGS